MSNPETAEPVAARQDPIFILGIMQRSGTNYLRDLLQLHPDCTILDTLGEDFLVSQLGMLDAYPKSVCDKWNPKWNKNNRSEELRQYLGRGLLSFLDANKVDPTRRLVTKTPSVKNIHHFPEFFPLAGLIIIIRRGENVVESGMKSFGWSFRSATIQWQRAARIITKYLESQGESSQHHIVVKYEDLCTSTENEVRRILDHFGLSTDVYDFEQARGLAVRGSSTMRSQGEGSLDWIPVEKTPDFKPLERASHWSTARKARFTWMAGRAAEELGYEINDKYLTSPYWVGYNTAVGLLRHLPKSYKIVYFLRRLPKSCKKIARRLLKSCKKIARRLPGVPAKGARRERSSMAASPPLQGRSAANGSSGPSGDEARGA